MLAQVKKELRQYVNPKRAALAPRFFRAGKGQYAEGDKFLGVAVPDVRKVVKEFTFMLELTETELLIRSEWHEERLCGLLMLVMRYQKSSTEEEQQAYIDFYIRNFNWVNNWDLVDSTAHHLLGHWLLNRNREYLHTLAHSGQLWQQRIAIVATLAFIRKNQYADTFALAETLKTHQHDLIHKATGWMLREAGKRNEEALHEFLREHYPTMPRTMLRYAIEKLPETERQAYLRAEV